MGKILLYAAILICAAGAIVDRFIHRFPTAGYIIFLSVCVLAGTLGYLMEKRKKGSR